MRAALLALLVGCTGPRAWGVSDLTVEGSSEFTAHVAVAVDEWDEALYHRCGVPVFTIVPSGGHPVREYTTWHGDDRELGSFDGDEISIRTDTGRDAWLNITLHELGHAMGLEHVTWQQDARSVMIAVAVVDFDVPTEGDVDRAAHSLGCEED